MESPFFFRHFVSDSQPQLSLFIVSPFLSISVKVADGPPFLITSHFFFLSFSLLPNVLAARAFPPFRHFFCQSPTRQSFPLSIPRSRDNSRAATSMFAPFFPNSNKYTSFLFLFYSPEIVAHVVFPHLRPYAISTLPTVSPPPRSQPAAWYTCLFLSFFIERCPPFYRRVKTKTLDLFPS